MKPAIASLEGVTKMLRKLTLFAVASLLIGLLFALPKAMTAQGEKAVEEARSTGEPVSLAPMTPFERKIVHDAVAAAGLISESSGDEPERYVIVRPS